MKKLIAAALIAAGTVFGAMPGAPAAPAAEAADIWYAAVGGWYAVVRPLEVTTPSGATVTLPLHIYVRGLDSLDSARQATITQQVQPGARGGTDVTVQVQVQPGSSGEAIAANAAVRGVDVPDGEGLFVQRGGTSDRPMAFAFHLGRA